LGEFGDNQVKLAQGCHCLLNHFSFIYDFDLNQIKIVIDREMSCV
jgi:hypothetical protein